MLKSQAPGCEEVQLGRRLTRSEEFVFFTTSNSEGTASCTSTMRLRPLGLPSKEGRVRGKPTHDLINWGVQLQVNETVTHLSCKIAMIRGR